MSRVWVVETNMIAGGWQNIWTIGDDEKPLTFTTKEEAESELEDLMEEARRNDLGYDDMDWRVVNG